MPKFGKKSLKHLDSCDPDLIHLFTEVIQYYDCKVTDGYRDEKKQNKYYAEGKSKLKYDKSGHNKRPSRAAEVIPYPVDWGDRERFMFFRGLVYGIAHKIGVRLKPTIPWDMPHYELK